MVLEISATVFEYKDRENGLEISTTVFEYKDRENGLEISTTVFEYKDRENGLGNFHDSFYTKTGKMVWKFPRQNTKTGHFCMFAVLEI